MNLEQMEAVLEPKVKGARLLNERLNESEHPLEFFVMFSSFVMVCGNPGQSAYSAANAYTHSLAQQRKARGLAGSTIDMGAIWGVGYIVRQGRDEEYETISFKFDKVSEQELHALLAEAVVSGRPDATDDVEVITGMRFLDPKNKELIPHFEDPRLGHFILSELRDKVGGARSTLESVKERLLKATTNIEARQIITSMALLPSASAVHYTDNLCRWSGREASNNVADPPRRQCQSGNSSHRPRGGFSECCDDRNLVSPLAACHIEPPFSETTQVLEESQSRAPATEDSRRSVYY